MLVLLQATLPAADGPDLTRYALVCGGLVLGILGLGYALKRVLGGTIKARAKTRSLEIVDVLPLSARQRLCVVRCYDRSFLVGVGEKELLTVAELDIEEVLSPTPDSLVVPTRAKAPARAARFDQLLAEEGVEPPTTLREGGVVA